MHETIGKYVPASKNRSEIIEKEWYGQGVIYKNWKAYENNPLEVCYIPELSNTKYTRKDFVDLCKGNEELARDLFLSVDWQSPGSLLEEWIISEGVIICENCGYMLNYYREKCPKCGRIYEDAGIIGIF